MDRAIKEVDKQLDKPNIPEITGYYSVCHRFVRADCIYFGLGYRCEMIIPWKWTSLNRQKAIGSVRCANFARLGQLYLGNF